MIVIITTIMATSMVSAAEPAQTNTTTEQTKIASEYDDAQAAADTAKSEAIRAEAEAAAAENRVIEYEKAVSDAQAKADQAKQDYDQAKANASSAADTASKTSDEIAKVQEEIIEYETTAAEKQNEADYWNNKVSNLTAAKIDCQEWIDTYQQDIEEAEKDRLFYFGLPDKTSQYLYQYAIEKKAKCIALKAEAEENMTKIVADLEQATVEAEKAARVAAQVKEIAEITRSMYNNICAEAGPVFAANKTAAEEAAKAKTIYDDAFRTATHAEYTLQIIKTDAQIAREAATVADEFAKELQAKADAIKNKTNTTPVTPVTPDTPVTPVTPETPVAPVTPETPVTPVTPETTVEKTSTKPATTTIKQATTTKTVAPATTTITPTATISTIPVEHVAVAKTTTTNTVEPENNTTETNNTNNNTTVAKTNTKHSGMNYFDILPIAAFLMTGAIVIGTHKFRKEEE